MEFYQQGEFEKPEIKLQFIGNKNRMQ